MKRNILILLTFLLFVSFLKAQERIKMRLENGVYTTPCIVNGLRLRFIFDTGASNVSISLSEAIFMLKNGYLEESDVHGSSKSQIANGDVVENTTITIKELEIGSIKLHDIEAIVIHELTAPLLLGQSAIQKLGKIQIEGDELVILSASSSSFENACPQAKELIKEAKTYDSKKLRALSALSANTYLKAYDLCPEAFNCNDIFLMGDAFSRSDNYQQAIKFLEKATKCVENKDDLFPIYFMLGNSYFLNGDFENSIINIQKALFYASDDLQQYNCYSQLGLLYEKQNNLYEAVNYSLKGVDFFIKFISKTGENVINKVSSDYLLGGNYWSLANYYARLNQYEKSDYYKIKAALCGDLEAIEYCRKYNLKY